jgi:ubiquinone/menaquinone biosynthesis C-methylase UbiE
MEYYDSISKGYDELYSDEQHEKLAAITRLIAIDKKSRMLDLGCGTGIASELADDYMGIDPSGELIKIAKQRYKQDKKKKFRVERAERLPEMGFKEKEFDYVISLSAIHHFSDLDRLFPEIKRIGRMFIVTILKKSQKHDAILLKVRKSFKVISLDSTTKDTVLICDCS